MDNNRQKLALILLKKYVISYFKFRIPNLGGKKIVGTLG